MSYLVMGGGAQTDKTSQSDLFPLPLSCEEINTKKIMKSIEVSLTSSSVLSRWLRIHKMAPRIVARINVSCRSSLYRTKEIKMIMSIKVIFFFLVVINLKVAFLEASKGTKMMIKMKMKSKKGVIHERPHVLPIGRQRDSLLLSAHGIQVCHNHGWCIHGKSQRSHCLTKLLLVMKKMSSGTLSIRKKPLALREMKSCFCFMPISKLVVCLSISGATEVDLCLSWHGSGRVELCRNKSRDTRQLHGLLWQHASYFPSPRQRQSTASSSETHKRGGSWLFAAVLKSSQQLEEKKTEWETMGKTTILTFGSILSTLERERERETHLLPLLLLACLLPSLEWSNFDLKGWGERPVMKVFRRCEEGKPFARWSKLFLRN